MAKVAGNAKIILSLDDRVKAGLAKVLSQAEMIGGKLKAVGAAAMALGGGIVTALGGAATAFANAGSELADMSKRVNFSVESLSELKYAAEQNGSSLEAIEGGSRKISKLLLDAGNGAEAAVTTLSQLGLTYQQLANLRPEDQFQLVAERIAAITNPAERAAMALQVLGKRGPELLPMIENLAAAREEARQLGLVMSEEDAAAADVLGDAIDRVKAQAKGLAINLGAAVSGPMIEFAGWVSQHLSQLIQWIQSNQELVILLAKIGVTLGATGAAAYGVGTAFTSVQSAIDTVVKSLNLMVAHPVLAGLAAITAAVIYLANEFRKAHDAWNEFDDAMAKNDSKQSITPLGDLNKMIQRYEQLTAKGNRSTEETREAVELVRKLREEYGDLAVSVDKQGNLANVDQIKAQLATARGGRSRAVIKNQLEFAKSSLAIANNRKGATEGDLATRRLAVEKLRQELELYDRTLAGATPTATVSATMPQMPVEPDALKDKGKEAGAKFGKAFIDFFKDKVEGAGDFVGDTLGGGLDSLLAMGSDAWQKIKDAQQLSPEVIAAKPQAALLDATFAAQQFGGRNEELQVLKDIRDNTKEKSTEGVPVT